MFADTNHGVVLLWVLSTVVAVDHDHELPTLTEMSQPISLILNSTDVIDVVMVYVLTTVC
jgi:hypothetical protein